ncbi:hypothetical protein Lser_V15G18617 [Lactuca serriola]
MDIFRLAGDMTHLASVLVLLLKIHTIKSCAVGFSEDSRALCIGVCYSLLGYIFTDFISLYNTIMKLIFLGSSFFIVWYIRRHKIVRRSYDKDQDTFRHYFLVLPCLLLALIIHEKFTFKEKMWTFSLYLEAVAILPQLVLIQRTRNIDNLTGQYHIVDCTFSTRSIITLLRLIMSIGSLEIYHSLEEKSQMPLKRAVVYAQSYDQEVYSKEMKGVISALASIQGYLLVASGPKVILHKWIGSELSGVAFFDAPPLYVVSSNIVTIGALQPELTKNNLWDKRIYQPKHDSWNQMSVLMHPSCCR